jgi:hypothetical protein
MMAAKPERRDPSVCLAKLSQRDLSLGLHSCPPEFPFCFPGDDSIPPVAAAAIFFCIRSRAKEPDAPGSAAESLANQRVQQVRRVPPFA